MTNLGIVGRTWAIWAVLCVMAALVLLMATDARAGDEDFFGVEGKVVALNVTVDPGGPVAMWWWDFEGEGCFTWSSSAGPNTTHVYSMSGLYYPVLRATNGSATVKTWIFKALIDPENEPPEVVVSHEYLEAFRGETVVFAGTAIDDGQVVRYEWDFDGDGTFDHESSSSGAATFVFTGLGEFHALFRATDDQGAMGTATVTVVVLNQPPTVRANDIVSDAEDVHLTVMADDPDGDLVSFVWDPGDGSSNVTTTGPTLVHRYTEEGEYRVWVMVTDEDGGTATTSFTVTRVPPKVLHEVIASVSEDEVFIGQAVTFQVDVIEGSPSTYSVAWHLGDGNGSTELTFEHTYGQPGTYNVRVDVTDSWDLLVSDELVVKVVWRPNEPPVAVPSVEQWVKPGHNLGFSEISYDPDGTIVLWQWDFDGDGEFDHTNTTDGNHTHVYPEEGLYTAILRVTDNRGEVGIATVNIKVDDEAPDDDPVDDSKGAAVCCGVSVVVLTIVAYWTMRRSMGTPRKDGGPSGPPEGEGPDGDVSAGEKEDAPGSTDD